MSAKNVCLAKSSLEGLSLTAVSSRESLSLRRPSLLRVQVRGARMFSSPLRKPRERRAEQIWDASSRLFERMRARAFRAEARARSG